MYQNTIKFLILLAMIFSLGSCFRQGKNRDDLAYESRGSEIDKNVENGSVYFFGNLSAKGIERITLVGNIGFIKCDRSDIFILGKSSLSFAGHPGKPMTFRDLYPKAIGLCIQKNELILVDAVSWDTKIEGGKYMDCIVYIPSGIEVILNHNRPKGYEYLPISLDAERKINEILGLTLGN